MNRKLFFLLAFICFALFSVMLIFSNQFDWDHFLSFFEVEYRSWILDHRAPLWSYQACAGASRIGDPQSFGLSPLFFFILIFGSFWGAKILTIVCALIGTISLAKTLRLLFPTDRESLVHEALSIFFIFGGYFLWHLHTGQITFALMLFVQWPIYLLLKILLKGTSIKDAFLFVLSSFTYLTAGFYHSMVFFVFPVVVGLLVLGIASWKFRADLRLAIRKNSLPTSSLIALSILASSYKWLSVLRYQNQFPRDLSKTPILENAVSLLDSVRFLMIPTSNYDFIPHFSIEAPYSIWEYSSFSALPWLLIALTGLTLVFERKSKKQIDISRLCLLAIFIFTLIPFLFLMGDENPLSAHSLLNEFIYHHSVRVVGRYLILLIVPVIFIILVLVKNSERLLKVFDKWLVPFGFLITIANLVSFIAPLDTKSFIQISQNPRIYESKMREGEFTELRHLGSLPFQFPFDPGTSSMYPTILRGRLAANCYQPLQRERKIATEKWLAPGLENIFSITQTSPNDDCAKSVYVTQNKIVWDRTACKSDLCVNLNMINPEEAPNWTFNENQKRYCLVR